MAKMSKKQIKLLENSKKVAEKAIDGLENVLEPLENLSACYFVYHDDELTDLSEKMETMIRVMVSDIRNVIIDKIEKEL